MEQHSIISTQDGSPTLVSDRFGVPYHSRYGAVQESRHVYIAAGLYYKSIVQKRLQVLDMGFGTGLNAFLLYLEARRLGLTLDLTSVEAYPVPLSVVIAMDYPGILEAESERGVFEELHRCDWNRPVELGPGVVFEKREDTFEDFPIPLGRYDLICYDAFAPVVQPHLWEQPQLCRLYDALVSGGVLVTYCAKGSFKRALQAVGFSVETLQGPPGKREMVRASRP
jgi:tRNA U34 5-methylaminomethyl-2-thiouridine-forming methyltransferase MnmC